MANPTARAWKQRAHGLLLLIWRYLPLPLRRLAVRLLYPRVPIGAVAVIRNSAGQVLLVRQTYHRGGPRWAAPGGWLSRGETPQQAAVREAWEETGLRVTAGRVLATDGGPYGEISLAFECAVVGDTGFVPSKETDQLAYFAPERLPPMTMDTRRLLENALAAQAHWRAIEAEPQQVVSGAGGSP